MKKRRIVQVLCREVLDSKGRPTVETDVLTSDGSRGSATAPCGTSVGSAESHFLRDGGTRLGGLGVASAVSNVMKIIGPALLGRDATNQERIDQVMLELDGTQRKSLLGANSIYSVSVAVARAAANGVGVPLYKWLADRDQYTLPIPALNIINGGHYGEARTETQEYLWIPSSARSYREALEAGLSVFYQLPNALERVFGPNAVQTGHSAGYAAPSNQPDDVIRAILDASRKEGGVEEGEIGLDVAAGQFYESKDDVYCYMGRRMMREEVADYLASLAGEYPLLFIEDPLHEDDFAGFAHAQSLVGSLPFMVGDDLFAMDVARLEAGLNAHSARALIFKPNMVGTVSEAMHVAEWADAHDYLLIPSIRSGSCADDPIPDFAVAVGALLMKSGAPRSGERAACHNRLLRIEEELGDTARFPSLQEIKARFAEV